MGGIGSGGARPGSGPKKKIGPRLANGRFSFNGTVCRCSVCGKHNSFTGQMCRPCRLAAAAWRNCAPRSCRHCGKQFAITSCQKAKGVYCTRACGLASAKERMAKFRNPNKSERLRERRRRASLKRSGTSWRPVTGRWRAICERDGWRCWLCGEAIDASLQPPARMAGTVDHVVPLANGGSDDDDNVRAAHLTCNSRRGASLSARRSDEVPRGEGGSNAGRVKVPKPRLEESSRKPQIMTYDPLRLVEAMASRYVAMICGGS